MQQVITLGGVTLPTKSRSFPSTVNNLVAISGAAADGTRHTDFINNKQTFVIAYLVITEATKAILDGLYLSQISTGDFLAFTYTDSTAAVQSFTVEMDAPAYGAINPKDTYYYNGVTLTLREV